uniref:Uncharacterized protein n=1 Tax=Glossina austeni TaxID=7395 RepID=A0A1A9UN67_GLOAU
MSSTNLAKRGTKAASTMPIPKPSPKCGTNSWATEEARASNLTVTAVYPSSPMTATNNTFIRRIEESSQWLTGSHKYVAKSTGPTDQCSLKRLWLISVNRILKAFAEGIKGKQKFYKKST